MSGYLHALWIEGLQEHKYNKVNASNMKSSSSLESVTRSGYHILYYQKKLHKKLCFFVFMNLLLIIVKSLKLLQTKILLHHQNIMNICMCVWMCVWV